MDRGSLDGHVDRDLQPRGKWTPRRSAHSARSRSHTAKLQESNLPKPYMPTLSELKAELAGVDQLVYRRR